MMIGSLVEKLFGIHDALSEAAFPHAFGGAIALAYCTLEPRGTRDLVVNIFASADRASEVLRGLPPEVKVDLEDVARVERDGQSRLWWGETPVDVFLSNMPFHAKVAERVRKVPLAGRQIPVLDCASLTVFKAFFDRTKDWADIEAIAERDTSILEGAAAEIESLAGADDPSRLRLLELADRFSSSR